MGRVPFPAIEDAEEPVALSKSATQREYMRLQALLLIKKELVTSRQHIADILSVHRQTVSEWLENYEKGACPCCSGRQARPHFPTHSSWVIDKVAPTSCFTHFRDGRR
jgi:hypothetical protein